MSSHRTTRNVSGCRETGMTLVEVMISVFVAALLIGGVLATLIQSRRLAAMSVAQGCAATIVEGYIEQLKNLPLKEFINGTGVDGNVPNLTGSYDVNTLKDQTYGNGWIHLKTTPSTVSASTLLSATPGTTPVGAVDNLQSFDMDGNSTATKTTWGAVWPNARNYPDTAPTPPVTTPPTPPYNENVPGVGDLRMNFWLQITDLTPTTAPRFKAYGILIVYTWQYVDGGKIRYGMSSVRTIRSAVQTF